MYNRTTIRVVSANLTHVSFNPPGAKDLGGGSSRIHIIF